MSKRDPFVTQGCEYDLGHLNTHSVVFVQPAKNGQPQREYDVLVEYSIHCFTREKLDTDGANNPRLYQDERETRMFDELRYRCSLQLPSIVRDLPQMRCHHTGKGNFFTIKLLDPQTGQQVDYEIYFKAIRMGGNPARVRLLVQSAYVRDRHHGRKVLPKNIGFFVILHNTLHGKPIKTPPQ